MYIYYGFFIIIWYALTVNFIEWVSMLVAWLLFIFLAAFIYWFKELLKESN